MDYAATRDAPAGETALLLPPAASGFAWIGGNTRGAAFAACGLASLALASAASRGARVAATALGDPAPVSALGYYFGPGELGMQPFFSDAGVGEGGVDIAGCPYNDPAVGHYSVVANCLAGGVGCQENAMCRTCTVVEPSELPKCPFTVCLGFGLDPSSCDPDPRGGAVDQTPPEPDADVLDQEPIEKTSELAAVETQTDTEPEPLETETETETEPETSVADPSVEAVEATDGEFPSAATVASAASAADDFDAPGFVGLGPPIADPATCTGSKFATELRHSGKYVRTGFSYIPTPGGGKRPSLRLAPGQTVRAVMITPKGALGRTSWRDNWSWGDVRVSEEASSWDAFVSSDACGQPAYADGGFYISPGEWNVYVSKAAVDVTGGFDVETWPSDSPFWSTWGGKTWAFGVVPGDLPGIQDGGCGDEMPIREEDFLMKVTWRSDGAGNHAGSYTVVARDEWGQTSEHTQTAEPGEWGLGGMKVRWMPVAESCESFPKTRD